MNRRQLVVMKRLMKNCLGFVGSVMPSLPLLLAARFLDEHFQL
jgi:hypothetical protein